jgi:hypothetical protein
MSDKIETHLPPLPTPVAYYTTEQMHSYAQAAVDSYIASTKKSVKVFSDLPRMRLDSVKGTPVIFDAGGGYDYQIKHAKSMLFEDETYFVEEVDVGSSYSKVKLQNIDRWFNTVLFASTE